MEASTTMCSRAVSADPATRPYVGLRVVDLSQGFAGPYATALLASQGADVVKVEPPRGDWSRGIGRRHGDETAFSIMSNVGKRSICLDARTSGGHDAIVRLVRSADVVVTNYRPEVAQRLGLRPQELHDISPRAVCMSIVGLGLQGAFRNHAATDMVLQGWSGLAVMTGSSNDLQRPIPLKFAAIDLAAGVFAAQRIAAHLYAQAVHGTGICIELSLLEAALALQSAPILDRSLAHAARVDGRDIPDVPLAVPSGVFEAADGHLMLSCVNDHMFAGIQSVLNLDPQLGGGTSADRLANAATISTAVATKLRERTVVEWLSVFAEIGVPCGPALSYEEVLDHPEIQRSGLFRSLRYNTGQGTVRAPLPPGSSGSDSDETRAPLRGEHTVEILKELGFDHARVDQLLDAGHALTGSAATEPERSAP